jgi:outer membrane protein insertion porin family
MLLTLATSLHDAHAQQDNLTSVSEEQAIADTPSVPQEFNTQEDEADGDDDSSDETEETEEDVEQPGQRTVAVRRINKITIAGNKNIPDEAILSRLPFRLGEEFVPAKTSAALRNLYGLNYFRQIEIWGDLEGEDSLNLHIQFSEKHKLEDVKYEGNKHLSASEIKKKIDFSKVPAVDEEELKKYASIIKNLYVDKNYHFAEVNALLQLHDDKATIIFDIQENKPSAVKQIFFKGNNHISAKKIREVMFTREDWVLGTFDSAGTYHPDAIERDRYMIETLYKNNGYLTARVTDVDVDMRPNSKNFYITFNIDEGPQYTISDIKVPGNHIMEEEDILRILPLRKKTLYSHSKVQKTLELLRTLWGEHGYIYADVEPSIQPDEENKTVTIAFYTELGSKVHLNRINIVGNKKSRDSIIRRQLVLDEGDLLTTQKMDFSKSRVELLGYFDKRDGVNWKINRVNDDTCNLDLMVKEVRTGTASLQVGAGGNVMDITDPTKAINVTFGFADTNFLGYGIHYDIGMAISSQEKSGHINVVDPWLFGKPISGALNFFASRVSYEDLRSVKQQVSERRIGGSAGLGFFVAHPLDSHVQFFLGAEGISYGDNAPKANIADQATATDFQNILNNRFQSGTLAWFSNVVNQDLRNHPMHPSRGYQWSSQFKVGVSVGTPGTHEATTQDAPKVFDKFGFVKFEGDATWYTPLIGESDLVLCLHGHVGVVHQFSDHTIPYRELFHVGGPATVRGFNFGQISPMFQGNSIGARKAFWNNIELIFPINPDFSIKGAIFYDGGAGWDTPDAGQIKQPEFLFNNCFNYRHAIGVGLRMLNPTPLQIDWGFKLDRNKRMGESVTEIHFTMNHNF